MKVLNSKIVLVIPDIKYKETFISGYNEFKKENTFIEANLCYINNNFETFVEQLKNLSNKIWYNPFFIPETIYWLIIDGKFVGRLSIRHRLNRDYLKYKGHIGYAIIPSERNQSYGNLILKLGLEKAKQMGFSKVLLTCRVDNLASKKIIEKNNGVYENSKTDRDGSIKLRYWINI